MAGGLVFAAGFLGLLVYGLVWGDPRAVPTPMVGGPAPDFALETLSGDTLRLSEAGDQPLVINFWASWCIPCQDEHPLLVDYSVAYKGRIRLIGIVYQDTRANAERWIRERGGDWTNALDLRSQTAIEYGVRGVPETFFITRDRQVLQHLPMPMTPAVLRFWTDSLLALGKTKAPGT